MDAYIIAYCSARLSGILGSRMCQETSLHDEFDLIETKCQGVYEKIHIRIQIRNLDEDVLQMLTIQIRIAFAAEFGNYIHEFYAIALWIRTHCHLVYGGWGSDLDCSVIMQPNLG